MFTLPNRGIATSVSSHNCDLEVVCDWIEASVLFDEEKIFKQDIIDILLEENIYPERDEPDETTEQDFANAFLDLVWNRLIERKSAIEPNYPFHVSHNALELSSDTSWIDYPAYSFCLCLSLAPLFKDWNSSFVQLNSCCFNIQT